MGHLRRRKDFNEDISRWDVSNVVNMGLMLCDAKSFNGDLSRWNVGQVQYMDYTFYGATSFTHQLGGAWATSTVANLDQGTIAPAPSRGRPKPQMVPSREWCRGAVQSGAISTVWSTGAPQRIAPTYQRWYAGISRYRQSRMSTTSGGYITHGHAPTTAQSLATLVGHAVPTVWQRARLDLLCL